VLVIAGLQVVTMGASYCFIVRVQVVTGSAGYLKGQLITGGAGYCQDAAYNWGEGVQVIVRVIVRCRL
jgi:hypothetical protein